jgi:GT2 family glycosyltransferase
MVLGSSEQFQPGLPVRYVYEPRVGIATAKNTGIRAASGEILAFTDDDAVVDPQWLGRIERAFNRDPQIGIVGGAIRNLECGRGDWTARTWLSSLEDSL